MIDVWQCDIEFYFIFSYDIMFYNMPTTILE